MNAQNQIIENFNELVFENRNKAYGAYILRKGYSNNVSFSLLLSILFFGLIALAALAYTRNNLPPVDLSKLIAHKDSTFTMLIELPHEEPKTIEPKKKVEIPKPHSDNPNYTVTDKKVETEVKTNDKLEITKNGTIEGKDTTVTTEIPPDVIFKKVTIENNDPKSYADEMPEFKGNIFEFIVRSLVYPRIAVENGTEGQVYLTFVVEKDGKIGDVKILKPLSDGCTEEAIRVVKSMPAWKPGKNHGEPVRVQFNLPIKFRLR